MQISLLLTTTTVLRVEPVPEETFTHSPILIVIQPLSASSIYYDPLCRPCSIYVLDNLFAQPLFRSSIIIMLW